MSDSLKKFIISALRTALVTFFTLLVPAMQSGGLTWTWSFWMPIIIGVLNAVARLVSDPAIPVSFGGTKR